VALANEKEEGFYRCISFRLYSDTSDTTSINNIWRKKGSARGNYDYNKRPKNFITVFAQQFFGRSQKCPPDSIRAAETFFGLMLLSCHLR